MRRAVSNIVVSITAAAYTFTVVSVCEILYHRLEQLDMWNSQK